jgi:hypothetical protein
MRRIATLAALLGVFLSTSTFAANLAPDLQRRLASFPAGEDVPVILEFAEHGDLGAAHGRRAGAGAVIRSLQSVARRSQGRVSSFLQGRGRAAQAKTFWINNSIAVRVPADLLPELEGFSEIETIEYDVPVILDGAEDAAATASVDWNMTAIRVDQVWSSLGFDGTGIVIGSMDSGFDPNHPALVGKWRGGTNSWKDVVNGQTTPYDDNGHGTHTMGTLVGGDGPGPFSPDIGVAYNAKFIAVKIDDATGHFYSASTVIAGAEWILDPDGDPDTNDFPDVASNSWLFSTQDFIGFHSAVAAWRAVGIIPVFAIGNNGPGGSTTGAPGNYDNTIGVGATTSSDVIASFSSRGPSPAGNGFPPDLRKPEISAPGQAVLSSVPGAGYAYYSGTSMATPHVAGTVALMLQAHPGEMSFDEVRDALITTSVDRGIAGYDYDYGYGRLDALGAVTEAQIPGIHLTGEDSNHSVQLTWNASVRPGVIRYDVYRSSMMQDVAPTLIGSSTDTAFTDQHRFGTNYYRVRAVRASDQLPFTNEVAVSTCVSNAPACASVNGFATSPVLADFNGDGDLDAAVTNTVVAGTVEVAYGDGSGHFGAPASFPAGDRPSGLVTGDFNSDGIADLAASNDMTAGTVSILLGNGSSGAGDGTFTAPVAYGASQKLMGLASGDFNQDGILDLAAVSNTLNLVAILIGNGLGGVGDGTFAPAVTYLVSTRPTRLVTGDFNGDGILDLAVACNGSGRVSILLGHQTGGHGDGTFLPQANYGSGIGTLDLATGDFNADGITDLAVTRNVDPGFVSILRGLGSGGVGNGTFATAVPYSAGVLPQGIATGDLNGDGITDLCFANGSISNVVSVLLGTGTGGVGDGAFERFLSLGAGTGPTDVLIADLDHDASPDVAIANLASYENVCTLLTGCGSDAGTGIVLIAPNGGEEWAGSTWHTIEWTKDPGVVSVNVEVSHDAGATWETIATDLTKTSFPWFVSNPTSAPGAARIRVSDPRLSSADMNDAGFTITPDIRLDVPRGPRDPALALEIDNPALDGLRVRFTLARRAPAVLEVMDAAGRRVVRRSVGELGAGDHAIDLGGNLRAGIYWVSLTQGERRVTRKAAMLR